MQRLELRQSLFSLVLAWTGARISEVLALTPRSFQVERGIVTIITLKRRSFSVREVPIPPHLMKALEACFSLRSRQECDKAGSSRVWPWCRVTGWRIIKRVMLVAQVTGKQACPKGFRHGFGVGTLQTGVPLNLVQRWMGHASMETTAIYADVCGPEEIAFAQSFWRGAPHFHRGV